MAQSSFDGAVASQGAESTDSTYLPLAASLHGKPEKTVMATTMRYVPGRTHCTTLAGHEAAPGSLAAITAPGQVSSTRNTRPGPLEWRLSVRVESDGTTSRYQSVSRLLPSAQKVPATRAPMLMVCAAKGVASQPPFRFEPQGSASVAFDAGSWQVPAPQEVQRMDAWFAQVASHAPSMAQQ